MSFIFGLMVGSALTSGGGNASLPNLGTIPFRCLSAFEQSEDAFRECRHRSMENDLYKDGCDLERRRADTGGCSIKQNITWEVAGLRELKQSIEARQK